MRILSFSIVLLISLLSCQKNKVNHKHSDMIGEWTHYTGIDLYYKIYIQSNGRGYIYEKNQANNGIDSQRRVWVIKNNKLIFSRLKQQEFDIDLYPTVADNLIIEQYDTIRPGRTYMKLDGKLFIKRE